jgi:hypothetical protein
MHACMHEFVPSISIVIQPLMQCSKPVLSFKSVPSINVLNQYPQSMLSVNPLSVPSSQRPLSVPSVSALGLLSFCPHLTLYQPQFSLKLCSFPSSALILSLSRPLLLLDSPLFIPSIDIIILYPFPVPTYLHLCYNVALISSPLCPHCLLILSSSALIMPRFHPHLVLNVSSSYTHCVLTMASHYPQFVLINRL